MMCDPPQAKQQMGTWLLYIQRFIKPSMAMENLLNVLHTVPHLRRRCRYIDEIWSAPKAFSVFQMAVLLFLTMHFACCFTNTRVYMHDLLQHTYFVNHIIGKFWELKSGTSYGCFLWMKTNRVIAGLLLFMLLNDFHGIIISMFIRHQYVLKIRDNAFAEQLKLQRQM